MASCSGINSETTSGHTTRNGSPSAHGCLSAKNGRVSVVIDQDKFGSPGAPSESRTLSSIPTMSLRLGDQFFSAPNAVVDQSLLAIRPAISFFAESVVGGRFTPLSSNDILLTAYGTLGPASRVNIQRYCKEGRAENGYAATSPAGSFRSKQTAWPVRLGRLHLYMPHHSARTILGNVAALRNKR